MPEISLEDLICLRGKGGCVGPNALAAVPKCPFNCEGLINPGTERIANSRHWEQLLKKHPPKPVLISQRGARHTSASLPRSQPAGFAAAFLTMPEGTPLSEGNRALSCAVPTIRGHPFCEGAQRQVFSLSRGDGIFQLGVYGVGRRASTPIPPPATDHRGEEGSTKPSQEG